MAFPGETEEDFNDTLDVVNTCKYDGAFTFIYSPRENTPAAKMKNDLTEAEKEDRLHRLNELVNVAAPKDTIGQIINVKITDAKSFSLDGEIIEN